jgi:hypothetical protein
VPSTSLANLARDARQMPLKSASQWRIRVIEAFPLGPTGDKKGLRAQAIAQDSVSRSLQITAFLDPDASYSYISCTLALYLLGEEGLKLARSAAHPMQLGQVGTILSCDDSRQTQTESFLLRDMDGVDMLLSPRSWMCLERQCNNFSHSDNLSPSFEPWYSHSSVSGASGYYETYRSSSEEVQAPTDASLSCASSGTPEPNSDYEPPEQGIHTPCSAPGAYPSPTPCCEIAHGTAQLSAEGSRKTRDLSLQEYHLPYRIAHRNDSISSRQSSPAPSQAPAEQKILCNSQEINTWCWDPEKQNYYCRDRDEDDEWYWYPTDIV